MSQFARCEVEGCGGRVLVSTGHKRCSHHRPRAPRTDVSSLYDTPEKRSRAKAARRRRRDAAGVLWL